MFILSSSEPVYSPTSKLIINGSLANIKDYPYAIRLNMWQKFMKQGILLLSVVRFIKTDSAWRSRRTASHTFLFPMKFEMCLSVEKYLSSFNQIVLGVFKDQCQIIVDQKVSIFKGKCHSGLILPLLEMQALTLCYVTCPVYTFMTLPATN